jgi:formate dehydrogenase iron-sulfur subunit
VLGFRTSWLSREVVAFGTFAGLAVAEVAARAAFPGHGLGFWLGHAAAASGIAGVACSVLLYDRTRRPFWRWTRSAWKFGLTAVALGLATTLVATTAAGGGAGVVRPLALVLVAVVATKLVLEGAVFVHLRDRRRTPMARTALLLRGELGKATALRFTLGVAGGVALPLLLRLLVPGAPSALVVALLVLAATLAGELLERDLFFRAVAVPRLERGAAA